MNASPTTAPSSTTYNTPTFWENLWRASGIGFVVLMIAADIVNRSQPAIAAVLSGIALLNLLWFVAALRTTLAEAGKEGWGAAATASSAALAASFFLLIALSQSGLYDFLRATFVLSSFPRAMLIMSVTFGLWRAGTISNKLFGFGVGVVVLVLLGGTTWVSAGFWAPEGFYSHYIAPAIGLLWVLAVSRVVLTRSPATGSGW